MKKKNFKRCPRCKSKAAIDAPRCVCCGLIFDRLKFATNAAGKQALAQKHPNKVVFDSKLPVDVNKWKLFLLALFFGFTGAQYAKVGRMKMFVFSLTSFLVFMIYGVSVYIQLLPQSLLSHKYWGLLFQAVLFYGTFSFMLWILSTFQILIGAFKVPVSIDENFVLSNEVDEKVAISVLQDAKKTRQEQQAKVAEQIGKKKKKKQVVCGSCGRVVKVFEDDTICPKCEEPLKEE